MILLYAIIAVFIAWIWVDYYRLIDIYEGESLGYFILTFLLGCASVLIVLAINYYWLDSFQWDLNGDFINDFLYCVFEIGFIEELAKTIPFLIIYFFFKKQINEPIDYLAFICVSALGFSAAENVMYFYSNGPYIINGRAILSTVGHMFDTSLIAYGIIQYKYANKKTGAWIMVLFFFLASLSHGFYDFWLMHEGVQSGGWLVTVLYFLITISVFAVILNNAINNSAFFTYKKVVDSNKVAKRLLTYYGIVFLIQFVVLLFSKSFVYAFVNLCSSVIFSGFIVFVSCVRLSRFKLIKSRWEKLKIELPFHISKGDPYSMRASRLKLSVKGESFNEAYISVFYEEYFYLKPMSSKSTYIGKSRLSFIEKKVFLKNDDIFYLAKVFHEDESGKHEKVLLRSKTSDITMVSQKYPIVAVLKIEDTEDVENIKLAVGDFKFKEWAYIEPKVAS